MKTITCLSLLNMAVVSALIINPYDTTLIFRKDYCGKDLNDVHWLCNETKHDCCSGTVQSICIPAGSQCCTTGYYCEADEDCYLYDDVQYCHKKGSVDSPSHVAYSDSVGETATASIDVDFDIQFHMGQGKATATMTSDGSDI